MDRANEQLAAAMGRDPGEMKAHLRRLLEDQSVYLPRPERFEAIDEPRDPSTFADAMAYAMEAIRSGPRELLPDFPANLAPGEARNAYGWPGFELLPDREALRRFAAAARRSGKTSRWEAAILLDVLKHEDACRAALERRGLAGLGFGLAGGAPTR